MEYILKHSDASAIEELLLYRKIVIVNNSTMVLDNCIELDVIPNYGCHGCNSGSYDITVLNGCDNIITNVNLSCEPIIDLDDKNADKYSYKIFVYAENKKMKILQVDGDDGNGLYGSGYTIKVKLKNRL